MKVTKRELFRNKGRRAPERQWSIVVVEGSFFNLYVRELEPPDMPGYESAAR